jgi:hypothetical protein
MGGDASRGGLLPAMRARLTGMLFRILVRLKAIVVGTVTPLRPVMQQHVGLLIECSARHGVTAAADTSSY